MTKLKLVPKGVSTEFEDFITCVYCGHVDEETCDYPVQLRFDGDNAEVKCSECGKWQTVVMCATYTFQSISHLPEGGSKE